MSDPLTRQDKYGKIPSWSSFFREGGGVFDVHCPLTFIQKYAVGFNGEK